MSEDIVKAAFIYNFILYTEWPEHKLQESPDTIKVCTIEPNVLGGALTRLQGRTVRGVNIEVKLAVHAAEWSHCHVLFVDKSAESFLHKLVESALKSHVLLVSDGTMSPAHESMIALIRDNDRMAFEVNYSLVKQAQLKMSSKLLYLAKVVAQ